MSLILINPYRFASSGVHPWQTAVLADSPEILYMTDEGTGTTLDDLGSASIDGTIQNGTTWGTSSPLGSEISLDGTNDYMNTPKVANLNTTQRVTVEWGMRTSTFNDGFEVIFEHTPNYNTNGGFVIYKQNNRIYVSGNRRYGGVSYYRENYYTAPSVDAWHFYSATISIADGTDLTETTLRIDGSAASGTSSAATINSAPSASDSTTYPVGGASNEHYIYCGARGGVNSVAQAEIAGFALFLSAISNTRRDAHASAFVA